MWNRFLSMVEIAFATGYCAHSGIKRKLTSVTGSLKDPMVGIRQLTSAYKGIP
jgi:hypothetical protein